MPGQGYTFLRCVAEDRPVGPDGATFEDGYRAALISEAMHQSAQTGQRVEIEEGATPHGEETRGAGSS